MNQNQFFKKINNQNGIFLVTVFIILISLYTYIAYTSFGYDDEYFNIRVISENRLPDLIRLIQSTDIHPPLSYILNYFLFQIFHSWAMVRVCSALFYLASLIYVSWKARENYQKLFLILLLGFNPNIMLWCTGLRWYAYITPLLLLLSVVPDWKSKFYWWYFFLIFLVICYLGYIGCLLLIPYFLYYWSTDESSFRKKLQRSILPAFLFGLFYLYQLFILFKVHLNTNLSNNEQVFNIKTSLISFVASSFSNQAVFPVSVFGLISIAGSSILFLSLLFYYKTTLPLKMWIPFAVTSFLLLMSGLAGKIRNLVLLEPSRNFLFTDFIIRKKNSLIILGLFLITIGNIAGIYNVITHQRTTKNAWNIPLHETLDTLNRMEQKDRMEVYFTHNPTFTYYLTTSHKKLISMYSTLYFNTKKVTTHLTKLAKDSTTRKNYNFIITYRGRSIPLDQYTVMMQAMRTIRADSMVTIQLGLDKDYTLKQRFFKDYPKYSVEIIKYYGVKSNDTDLHSWESPE